MNSIINFFLPAIAYAQTATSSSPIKVFVGRVDRFLINPLIVLMFGAALVYFLFGVVEFLINQANAGEKGTGKEHMLWGVIGMFIMFSAYGIIHLLEHTLGVGPNPLIG